MWENQVLADNSVVEFQVECTQPTEVVERLGGLTASSSRQGRWGMNACLQKNGLPNNCGAMRFGNTGRAVAQYAYQLLPVVR